MKCLSPITIPNPCKTSFDRFIQVPCGRCAACLSRRRNEWSYRLEYELKHSISAFFVTLTYDDSHLHFDDYSRPIVCKRDIQLFLKRLRKACSGFRIRYYLCAEYGPSSLRPHYHGIIFNLPFDREVAEETILKAWDRGFVKVGTVTQASIAYVTKYCITKKNELDGREPVFALMSRKPGLGSGYVDQMKAWHQANEDRMYSPKLDGVRVPIPRYFKEKVYDEKQRKRYAVKCAAESRERELERKREYRKKGRSEKAYYRDCYDRAVHYSAVLEKKVNKMQKL